jgi:cell division protein FtsB
VNQTKIEPDPNAKPEPEIIKETDQKRLTQVKMMRVAMIVLGVLSVALLAWIIWRSADLLM